MRLIYNIETREPNKKAAALAPVLKMYRGCLMTAAQYEEFVKQVKGLCKYLDEKYPRTTPYQVAIGRGPLEHIRCRFMLRGTDKVVARIEAAAVESVLDDEESITPVRENDASQEIVTSILSSCDSIGKCVERALNDHPELIPTFYTAVLAAKKAQESVSDECKNFKKCKDE